MKFVKQAQDNETCACFARQCEPGLTISVSLIRYGLSLCWQEHFRSHSLIPKNREDGNSTYSINLHRPRWRKQGKLSSPFCRVILRARVVSIISCKTDRSIRSSRCVMGVTAFVREVSKVWSGFWIFLYVRPPCPVLARITCLASGESTQYRDGSLAASSRM